VLANLLAVAEAHGLRPELRSAFLDAEVNALLGVDGRREAAVAVVAVVALGTGPASAGEAAAVTPLALATEPLSRAEIEFPLIWQTHAATSLDSCDDVRSWRERARAEERDPGPRPFPDALALEPSIERRGSTRRFAAEAPALEQVLGIIGAAKGSRRSDHARASALVRPLLIVNRVEGLAPGVYSTGTAGEPVLQKPGDFAMEAAHLALDQPAAASAAVNVYFAADLDEVTGALGGRGYRAAQLEAGIRTGQVYLAATALGLRATGLTFYDDEVARFLGIDPAGTAVLMLAAFGA